MSEPESDVGTVEKPLDWAEALSETVKAASEPDPSTETPAEPVKEPSSEDQGELRVEESKDALQPLEKWPDEVKTLFTSLDKKAQQFLLDREKDVETHLTKRTQELSEVQKRYQRIEDVLKPYDEVAKRSGVDLTPHVAQALQHYMAFQRDPASTLKQLIQAAQLSQDQLFGEDHTDPAIRALRSQLENTNRELANLRQGQSQVTESQYAQQIQAFKDAKNEQGEVAHPYFDRVRTLMAPLVDAGKTLDEAYNEVVWTVPEHRQSFEKVAKEAAEKEAKAKAEKARLEKLRNAKKAGDTLPASDAEKSTTPKQVKNWEEALRETWSQTH